MFTDTHCHITAADFECIDAVIENAKKAKVHRLINNGTNAATNAEVLELSQKYEEILPALGIHPEEEKKYSDEDIQFIEDNIERIVAIGEIGLDYHYDGTDRDRQKELLEKQLRLAEKYDKPVIIHSRDATEDTIDVLKRYPRVRGSIHCFSGSYETAMIYIAMGYKLGFNGVVTFKNAKIKEVLKRIPASAILLETDCPYLAPEPVRGTKNEPKNISHIASFIAKERNMPIEELMKVTEENVHDLFDI